MAKETSLPKGDQPQTPVKRKFNLKRKEVPFDIEKPDGGDATYVLREMDGAMRDEYLNLSSQRVSQGKDGATPTVLDYTGLYAALLCRCVYDDRGVAVKEETIQSWPMSVQADLHEMAQELNGLNAKAKEQAKNA